MIKRAVILVVSFLMTTYITAQDVPVPSDSAVNRIIEILAHYNETVIYIDTSDYEINPLPNSCINLQIAASRGYCYEIVRLIAKSEDKMQLKCENASPLHYAVSNGKKDAAEILLLLGSSIDKYDLYGNTPLVTAVKGNDLEMAEMLIRHGASLTLSDWQGATALHHSAALGYFYLADLLLYYDSPVGLKDHDGNTPLMVAVLRGYYDIADILLGAGSDPNTPDNDGFTPMMAAAQNDDTLMLRMLINSGGNIYTANNDGFDALCIAIRNNRKDAVGFLLENGNRWDSQNSEKQNPINVAISYDNRHLISILKDHGFHSSERLNVNEINFAGGGMTSNHYSLLTGGISIREPNLKAGITIGACFNPVKTRLLLTGDEDVLYQYRVRMSVVHAGIFKEFPIYEGHAGTRLNLLTTLSAGYRFYSKFGGTRDQPANDFCIIPSAELKWIKGHFGIKGGCTWLKTPFYKVSPLWISLGATMSFFNETPRTPGKKIRYNYE